VPLYEPTALRATSLRQARLIQSFGRYGLGRLILIHWTLAVGFGAMKKMGWRDGAIGDAPSACVVGSLIDPHAIDDASVSYR
jgi:hypothetical protein